MRYSHAVHRDLTRRSARGTSRCFFDADEEIELWRMYLAEELPLIYGEEAVAVVFESAEYAAMAWRPLG